MAIRLTQSRNALRFAQVYRQLNSKVFHRNYFNMQAIDILKTVVTFRTKGWSGTLASKDFESSTPSQLMQQRIVRSVDEAESSVNEVKGEVVRKALQEGTLGFGFSAGGLLFPYYIGVLYELNTLGIITGQTKLAGSSAGSLIAACFHSGMSKEELTEDCLKLAHDCRTQGTRGRLRSVLKASLSENLAEDAHERCTGKTYVAVTQAFPRIKGVILSEYHCREDLISALLTSCHIPWWFDNTLVTSFRGQFHFDGGLSYFIPRPPVEQCVSISCFPSSQLPSVRGVSISPDSYEEWPYSLKEMLSWAFEPAQEDMLLYLIEKGEKDARNWAQDHKLLDDDLSAADTAENLPLVENIQ